MINPLHPPVQSSQHSSYSTLSNALIGCHASSSRRRLPQPAYTPASKWRNTTGRAAQLYPSITFDYAGRSNQGVRMRDLIARDCSRVIVGGIDNVFAHCGLKRINFRILVSSILFPFLCQMAHRLPLNY